MTPTVFNFSGSSAGWVWKKDNSNTTAFCQIPFHTSTSTANQATEACLLLKLVMFLMYPGTYIFHLSF